MIHRPVLVYPETAVVVQPVLTPLLAMTALGGRFDSLLFVGLNDGAVPYTLTLETAEVADAVDADRTWVVTVPAKVGTVVGQGSIFLGPGIVHTLFRVSAQSTGAAVNARWLMRGMLRPMDR